MLAEDARVAVVTEVGQVGDVELELAAVLAQGYNRGNHLWREELSDFMLRFKWET